METKQQCGQAKSLASHGFLATLGLCVLALIFPGCACPHRKAESRHTADYYESREDGLIEHDEWIDTERGGGLFLFADPTVQSLTAIHTNQTALGGGSSFITGKMNSIMDSNAPTFIGAAGTAAGNIIGAAAKTAVK